MSGGVRRSVESDGNHDEPTIGRIVHIRRRDTGECVAAIVTGVRAHDPDTVDLTVFAVDATLNSETRMSDAPMWTRLGVEWHWPERTR